MAEAVGVVLIQELTSTLPGSTLESALSTSMSLTKPRASCRSLPQDSGFHKVLLYRAGQSKENIKKLGSHLGLGRGSNKSELLCHERTADESRSAVRNPRCLLTASSKAGCLWFPPFWKGPCVWLSRSDSSSLDCVFSWWWHPEMPRHSSLPH